MLNNNLTLTVRLHTSSTDDDCPKSQTMEAEIDMLQFATLLQRALTAKETADNYGLLAFVRKETACFAHLVGTSRSRSSMAKYVAARTHLEAYVHECLGENDCPLSRFDADFIAAFTRFMQQRRHLANGTVRLYLVALKSWLAQARRQGLLHTDPFAGFRLPPASHVCCHLSADDLRRLSALPLQGIMERVRDLFLLSCYTGLSYADLCTLLPAHVERHDGDSWLTKPRKKNGQNAVVRLLPEALTLIDRLAATRRPCYRARHGWLDVPKNQTCNNCLRRLSVVLSLAAPVHFHVSRHTFATILLTAGVPIETVSLMLGHARIATTQIYAAVTRQKIANDTDNTMRHAFFGGK